MEAEKLYDSLEDYYKYVDTLEKINSIGISHYTDEFRKKAINWNDIDKKKIELEIDCIYFLVRNGKIEPIYTQEREDGVVESYPNLSLIVDADIEYLKKRL